MGYFLEWRILYIEIYVGGREIYLTVRSASILNSSVKALCDSGPQEANMSMLARLDARGVRDYQVKGILNKDFGAEVSLNGNYKNYKNKSTSS